MVYHTFSINQWIQHVKPAIIKFRGIMSQKNTVKIITVLLTALLFITVSYSQEDPDMPHGDDFEYDCDLCHSTENWTVEHKTMSFNHEQTG